MSEKQKIKRQPNFIATVGAQKYLIDKILARKTPDASIRIGVKGAGCSGYAYHIEFEDLPQKETDLIFAYDKITILIDPKSIIFLEGSVLDVKLSMLEKVLFFKNPNEEASCSCGNSFQVKPR